jgi:hypothetical protein
MRCEQTGKIAAAVVDALRRVLCYYYEDSFDPVRLHGNVNLSTLFTPTATPKCIASVAIGNRGLLRSTCSDDLLFIAGSLLAGFL